MAFKGDQSLQYAEYSYLLVCVIARLIVSANSGVWALDLCVLVDVWVCIWIEDGSSHGRIRQPSTTVPVPTQSNAVLQ